MAILLVSTPALQAQLTSLGARATALGGATSALPGDQWSLFSNPAMIQDQSPVVSFFAIRYYEFSELTDIAVAITYPTNWGVIGGGAHRYGNDLYNEIHLRLGYKNAWKNFYYGAAVTYNHVVMGGGYGSVDALGIDVGIAASITDHLWIGAKATNINQPQYGHYNDIEEDLPRYLSIGLAYQLSDIALFTTEVIKDVAFPIAYRAGVEVIIIDRLAVRAGITTNPQTFSGGLGYNTPRWGVNLVAKIHEESVLGVSPGLDFNISW